MAIQSSGGPVHWSYFVALEEDFEKVARYIEFHEDNLTTYSIELSHLFIAASSETDVLMKLLCDELTDKRQHKNIENYRATITESFPVFLESICHIPKFRMYDLNPWENWGLSKPKSPDWWGSYNNVKHHRGECFNEANLGNVINAMAGLYITYFAYYYIRKHKKSLEADGGVLRSVLAPPDIGATKAALNKRSSLLKFSQQ